MKSKKTTLLLGLCALLSGTTVAVICNSGMEMTTAVGCSHIGNHYSEYAATYEHSGVKEYWVCCSCHEHFLILPQYGAWVDLPGVENPDVVSTDDRFIPQLTHNYDTSKWIHDECTHWHACIDEGYEHLRGDEEEHYDYNFDYFCDECERELDGVEITNIIMPVDRISIGEHTTLTAEVTAYGSYSDEVYWTLDTTTTKLSLVDNENNTCTLTGLTGLNAGTVNNFKITAHSVDDLSVSKTVTFYASCWPIDRIQAIIDLVGEDYVLPYCTFKAVGDFQYDDWYGCVSGYVKDTIGATNVIKAFDNNGTFTKSVDGDHTYYTKDIVGSNDYVKYDVYVSYGWSYVDVYRIEKPLTSFPTQRINNFFGDSIKCSVIAPDDGTTFAVEEEAGFYIAVSSDCDKQAYIEKLTTAGYGMMGDDTSATLVSPDRTLIVVVTTSYEQTCFTYRSQEVPTTTDWSDADKSLMTEKIGLVLPFVNGNYGAWSYYSYYNYIYAYAYMSDAYLEAIKVFDATGEYTKSEISGGTQFKKSTGETAELVITVEFDGTMKAQLDAKSFTDWKATEIALALGDKTTVTLPEAVGSYYKYVFGQNTVSIETDAVMSEYQTTLLNNGFTNTGSSGWTENYESSDNTLTVNVTDNVGYIKIVATAHDAKPEPGDEGLPRAEIAAYLTGISADDLPNVTTGSFEITNALTDDVTVSATNSDIVTFRQAIAAISGAAKIDGKGNSWSLNNGLYIDIVEGSDYSNFTINFYVFPW